MSLRKTGQTVRIERARAGKIIFNNKNSVLDCVVSKQTETSAVLSLRNTMLVPEVFELQIPPGGESYICETVEKSLFEIGVATRPRRTLQQ